MSIELSSKSEKIVPYQCFPTSGNGRVIDLMPELIKAGYRPGGIATFADRRQTAPEDVRPNWNDYSFTGDSGTTDRTGGTILTLDSPILIALTSKDESRLLNGALPLTQGQRNDLKRDKELSLYLTPDQVEEANGKGYLIQDGSKVVAANKVVARAWDHLLRGGNVREYAQFVADTSKSNDVMRLYFDRSNPETPRLRSLVVDGIDSGSDVYGYDDLDSIVAA